MEHRLIKHRTIKLLEDNRRENVNDLAFGNSFLDTTPEVQSMKEKSGKLDFIKFLKISLQMTLLREWKDKHRENLSKTHIW